MKPLYALIASTKNNNPDNLQAQVRINEIYNYLKETKKIDEKEAKILVREALELKKIPNEEINSLISPTLKLFCFPYAGGSASLYEKWANYLPTNFVVVPVEYPGRGKKSRQPLAFRLNILLSMLEKEILSQVDSNPFVFFGHSLGAIIALELALTFSQKYKIEPKALYLSASPPPDTTPSLFRFNQMNDEKFMETIMDLNGTHQSLIHTKEFRDYFLPILRNDFGLLDDYFRDRESLNIPITVFGGKNDIKVPFAMLNEWKYWTKNKMVVREIDGDHFFIHQTHKFLEILIADLCHRHS